MNSTLEGLPAELKVVVAELLHNELFSSSSWDPTFFQLRLVSAQFADVTEYIMIRHARCFQDSPYRRFQLLIEESSFELLEAVLQNPRLTKEIQHIVVVPRVFNPDFHNFDLFKSVYQTQWPNDPMERWVDYTLYVGFAEAQQQFFLDGISRMAAVLSRLPIQKVTFTDALTYKWPQRRLADDYFTYPGWRAVIQGLVTISWDILNRPVWTFLQALDRSGIRLKHLEFKGIPTSVLWTYIQSDEQLVFDAVMEKVTQLVVEYHDSGPIALWAASRRSGWGNLFKNTTKLENLELSKVSPKMADAIWYHAGAMYWPALRVITLHRLTLNGVSLLSFIQLHKPTLKDINLLYTTLTDNYPQPNPWPEVVSLLVSSLRVTALIELDEHEWQHIPLERLANESQLTITDGKISFGSARVS